MNYFYKRRFLSLALALTIFCCFLFGCNRSVPPLSQDHLDAPESVKDSEQEVFVGLSVHYLDVGQGDCTLICFPDGKSMLIDCGSSSHGSLEGLVNLLGAKNISALDYLVLTHPDGDHIGGVTDSLKDIAVNKVYHPDIPEGKAGFEEYFLALDFLKDNGAETKISLKGERFGQEYKVAFLSQTSRKLQDSCYRDIYLTSEPTEKQINNLSPYIYLEYKGVRFLFTGDADSSQENKLINDYQTTLKQTFKDFTLKLEDIDFLKVAHHGSNDASSNEFLQLLRPKNSVISVGGENIYGHPASSALVRLNASRENHSIWRTDSVGTVSVFVSENGVVNIKTQAGEKTE